MKKTIVIYFSRKGSNRYLAEKIADHLKCDLEEIKPRLNTFMLILLFSSMKVSLGIRNLKHHPENYDRVILCGPIFMGKLISPLRSFIQKYRNRIQSLYFVTCCGSGYEVKDDQFGHNNVFHLVEDLLGEKCEKCLALPIGLVVPENKRTDGKTIMETHLSDNNFKGEIEEIFSRFLQSLNES
ncbi:MAG: flavodoxin domain-containing protein [Prolixibacteraceae bacterium]